MLINGNNIETVTIISHFAASLSKFEKLFFDRFSIYVFSLEFFRFGFFSLLFMSSDVSSGIRCMRIVHEKKKKNYALLTHNHIS